MASVCGVIPPELPLDYDPATAFISRWEVDLRKTARARVLSFHLPADYGADLEQEARLSLLTAFRRYAELPEQLTRTVLGHSVLKASVRESRRHARTSAIEDAEQIADDSARESYEPILIQRLANAIKALPSSLRQIYRLIYEERVSQREAASRLEISQPRVSKLHQQLKASLEATLTRAE